MQRKPKRSSKGKLQGHYQQNQSTNCRHVIVRQRLKQTLLASNTDDATAIPPDPKHCKSTFCKLQWQNLCKNGGKVTNYLVEYTVYSSWIKVSRSHSKVHQSLGLGESCSRRAKYCKMLRIKELCCHRPEVALHPKSQRPCRHSGPWAERWSRVSLNQKCPSRMPHPLDMFIHFPISIFFHTVSLCFSVFQFFIHFWLSTSFNYLNWTGKIPRAVATPKLHGFESL